MVDEADPPAADEDFFDHQGAALWLTQVQSTIHPSNTTWLVDVVRSYAGWTASANGAGLSENEEISRTPAEWNIAYFGLLAHTLPRLTAAEIAALALTPICSLPDEPFFDVTTYFVPAVDDVYFNEHALDASEAVRIREALARRLVASRGWRWVSDRRDGAIEVHIGPAIAVLFFNDYSYFKPSKAYVNPIGMERVAPFLPSLETLVLGAPSLFVAVMTLNLLEVSPHPSHLRFIVASANRWLASFPDARDFWIDQAVGSRVCGVIEAAWRARPEVLAADVSLRKEVHGLLASLVRLGISEATRVERALVDAPPNF